MISNQIFEKSSDKNHFDKAAPDYNIAVKNSGFNENVTYIPSHPKRFHPKETNYLVQSTLQC